MTKLRLAAVAFASLLGLAACSPRLLPGTDIPDTADTRAVFAVVQAYKAAAERRDAMGVLALISDSYFDDAGTPDPADDLDFAGLVKALPGDLARVINVRMDLSVSRIDVNGDRASAYLKWDARYRVSTRAGEVAKAQADVSRLQLSREKGAWKITAGL
jgi:ketosteroid isomerase-like protein